MHRIIKRSSTLQHSETEAQQLIHGSHNADSIHLTSFSEPVPQGSSAARLSLADTTQPGLEGSLHEKADYTGPCQIVGVLD